MYEGSCDWRDCHNFLRIIFVADDVVRSAIMVSCICGVFFPLFFPSPSIRCIFSRSFSYFYFPSSSLLPFVTRVLSGSRMYIPCEYTYESPSLLFPSFSLVYERHSVAFCLYLSTTGRLSCGSVSIYKASGRLLFSATFSRRTLALRYRIDSRH